MKTRSSSSVVVVVDKSPVLDAGDAASNNNGTMWRRRRRRVHRTMMRRQQRQRKRPRRWTTAAAAIAFLVLPCCCTDLYASSSSAILVGAAAATTGNATTTPSSSSRTDNANHDTAVTMDARTTEMEGNASSTSTLVEENNVGATTTTETPPLMKKNNIDASSESSSSSQLHDVAPSHSSSKSMEQELLLHAEHQRHYSKEKIRDSSNNNNEQQEAREHKQFMDWCQQVLGIQTSLEIHTFYYHDYMTAAVLAHHHHHEEDTDDDDDFEMNLAAATDQQPQNNNKNKEWQQDPPLIPVRGLRATRDIEQGQVVISIPFQALLTVSTTIDQDPVLGRVMGPEARQAYGWTQLGPPLQEEEENNSRQQDSSVESSVDFFEMPLLAVALMHHCKLGTSSPMYPYIHLLRQSPLDSVPFLWNKQQRRKRFPNNNRGIQTVARSIRLEMKDMYHTVVDTLARDHPDLFGKKDPTAAGGEQQQQQQQQEYDVLDDEDWAFSFENFQWAFAMVNSRHWLLPIVDLETKTPSESPPISPMMMHPQGSVDGLPPAEMPTDSWLDQQEEEDDEDKDEQNRGQQRKTQQEEAPEEPPSGGTSQQKSSLYHSFLAPVADMLNFGPPCTRGRYNKESHTFDIIASCNFTTGQEVTFWYSDECEDVIIGNYGFTHPMVPKCPTADDYRQARDKWKQRAANLQEALEDAYEDLDVIDTSLEHVQQVLANCDCCDTATASSASAYKPQQQEQLQQQQRQRQGNNVEGLHGNNLRNPPSQIRGGGGAMMSVGGGAHGEGGGRSSRSSSTGRSRARDTDHESRSRNNPRGSVGATDDDVEHHGVRRMWAGRSAL